MAVNVVRSTGRNLISPAFKTASLSGVPCSRSWFVKSTSRIEFLISIPISATKPIAAANESVYPVKYSIRSPPITPSGITDRTISVLLNVLNSSIRIAKIPKIATRIAEPMPEKLCLLLSISPAGISLNPSGSLSFSTLLRIFFVTLSVLYPVITAEETVMDLSLL